MSQCTFESAIKTIPYSQETVYTRISDLNNLGKIRERITDPAVQAAMAQQLQPEKLTEMQQKLQDMEFDADSVRLSAPPLGNICLRIIERDIPKCVKFEAEGIPMAMNLWIQLLPQGNQACKMKITLRAELNMLIKGMVSKPLQQGVDRLADMLSTLPYGE